MLAEVRVAGIVESGGEGLGKPDALVELADGEQSGVAGQLAWRWLDDERRAEELQALLPGRRSTHVCSPGRIWKTRSAADSTHAPTRYSPNRGPAAARPRWPAPSGPAAFTQRTFWSRPLRPASTMAGSSYPLVREKLRPSLLLLRSPGRICVRRRWP